MADGPGGVFHPHLGAFRRMSFAIGDPRVAKRAAREHWKRVRAELRSPEIEAALNARLIEAVPRDMGPVAGFWPIGSEPDIRPALIALFGEGIDILLPSSGPPGSALVFRSWNPEGETIVGRFGIVEPALDRPVRVPGVVLTPLLAFDDRGHRLGYGAGYYDRTLAGLRDRGRVTALGVAYSGQRMERVPNDRRDQPLDRVITEMGSAFRAVAEENE